MMVLLIWIIQCKTCLLSLLNCRSKSVRLMSIVRNKHLAWLCLFVNSMLLLANPVPKLLTKTWTRTTLDQTRTTPRVVSISLLRVDWSQKSPFVKMINLEDLSLLSKIERMAQRALSETGTITRTVSELLLLLIQQPVRRENSGLEMNTSMLFKTNNLRMHSKLTCPDQLVPVVKSNIPTSKSDPSEPNTNCNGPTVLPRMNVVNEWVTLSPE